MMCMRGRGGGDKTGGSFSGGVCVWGGRGGQRGFGDVVLCDKGVQ